MLPQASKPLHPAPGFRDAGHQGGLGDLIRVGNNGASWSSTSNLFDETLNGMCMGFRTELLIPTNALYHAYGFQLRCLSE
ncbi:hypothetical protein [uncultured Rikenella sp.]|uniref:hypothetical protein n=1 Tax=uncultured Rikenella sp. TaxID=368003 RepID=UPI0025F241D2|nr:hypothetical protein [uncultured Rikenella sp.]